MKKIKIAQIGTSKNSHGNQIWSSLLRQSDIFEVVGYAMPEGEREKFPGRIKAFSDYQELTVEQILNDPEIEAVTIETEEIYLTKYALMAAKAGKHVHMEKPGGREYAEFSELVETLRRNNLAFTVGYMYRFNPKIKEAFEKIERGELGRIYSVEAQMNCRHPIENRAWLANFPGGMLFFLGCHLIDLIYRIQGEPDEIIPLSQPTGIDGIQAPDFGMAVFKYRGGVSFAKTSAAEVGGFLRRQLVICGERGSIEIKPLEVLTEGGQYTVMKECCHEDWNNWNIPWEESKSEVHHRYDPMMRNFAEIVRGKENPYGYDYELGLYRLILRACGKEI